LLYARIGVTDQPRTIENSRLEEEQALPFDYSDLEPREMARLALEYVRETASWFEQAPGEPLMGSEATHVLTAISESSRDFSRHLASRYDEFIDAANLSPGELANRLRQRSGLESYRGADITARDVLDAACAEQQESYHFFLEKAGELQDQRLAEMFSEIAEHTRTILIYLEEERQSFRDREGT
jgi:hypothetical protein